MKAEKILVYTKEPSYFDSSAITPRQFFLEILEKDEKELEGQPLIYTALHRMGDKDLRPEVSISYRRGLRSMNPQADPLLLIDSDILRKWLVDFSIEVGADLKNLSSVKGTVRVRDPTKEQLEAILDFHLPDVEMPMWICLNMNPEYFDARVVPHLIAKGYEGRIERRII